MGGEVPARPFLNPMAERANRLTAITLGGKPAKPEAAQEQAVTIADLLDTANFELANGRPGPYALSLANRDDRLEIGVHDPAGGLIHGFGLSLKPFARVMRDYLAICDSYEMAVRGSSPHAIEAIDMARRATHNEGADLLAARLEGKIVLDHATARRLFSLICSLAPQRSSAGAAPVQAPSRPRTVLFVCNQNAIRSPMAAAIARKLFGDTIYAASAGLEPGDPDPFVSVVMDEANYDLGSHRPHSVHDDEELGFDLIITLSAEAAAAASTFPRGKASAVENWLLPDPSLTQGTREQMLDAYRALREDLTDKIRQRFA
jgi:uncharacterized protein (UPF0262 family)/protein-tyrosine-phosphatase